MERKYLIVRSGNRSNVRTKRTITWGLTEERVILPSSVVDRPVFGGNVRSVLVL